MKISRELPQFNDVETYIVVAGFQEAEFYRAFKGDIEKIYEFYIPAPKYSDREGFFEISGREFYGSGSVYEAKKQKIRDEFCQDFVREIKRLKLSSEKAVFIFAPKYFLSFIGNEIRGLRKNLKYAFPGNYFRKHPFFLIQKIKQWQEGRTGIERSAAIKPQVERLLNKTDKAKNIEIRGKFRRAKFKFKELLWSFC